MTTLDIHQAVAIARSDALSPVIKQEPNGGAYIYFERQGAVPSFYIGHDEVPTKFIGVEDAGNLLRDVGVQRCTYEF